MKYEDISKNGYPLGFLIKKADSNTNGLNKTFTSHTRQMDILQKESIGYEGDLNSTSFRLTSDEGKHLNGTDLAPFPLGFFNASIHGDIVGTIMKQAASQGLKIDNIDCEVLNSYYLTGSFVKGDGKGHAEPTTINLDITTSEKHDDIKNLILKASRMAPVLAGLRTALKNTFALYANGRRKDLSSLNESMKTDAEDPYQQYKVEPSPSKSDNYSDRMIVKTGEVSAGTVEPVDGYNVPKGQNGNAENPKFNKIIRTIVGKSSTNANSKIVEVDTVLGLPGMTHFVISCDIDGIIAPSPVNVMGAAISFCFLTQTHRYIHHQKFAIEGLRMSQYASFKENSDGTVEMMPLDTHLYMNGTAPDEHNEKLIDMSERTCYLHATLCEALEPKININFK
jgi:uncharacterized OsmC-like protein